MYDWLTPSAVQWSISDMQPNIFILDDTSTLATLEHELGHALTLEHVSRVAPDDTTPSIMYFTAADRIYPRDIVAARKVLDNLGGCGSIEPHQERCRQLACSNHDAFEIECGQIGFSTPGACGGTYTDYECPLADGNFTEIFACTY